ncbi:MAG: hypothetical protein CXT73_00885 [Methanobacteriota archaeon]|jgi:hypothetical protein|nr:MAG: hypothetical protein CXT73_00885 [Euryarchaeota archaeon]
MARTTKEKQMGRPINKRHFGTPDAGTDFKVRYRATGESEANGWIVKQVGSKRFKCTDGTNPMVCALVDKNQGTLAVGDMSITVKEGSTYSQVTKITGRRVTLGDTGVQVAWDFTGTGTTVEMEEAGTDASFTGTDDFETD